MRYVERRPYIDAYPVWRICSGHRLADPEMLADWPGWVGDAISQGRIKINVDSVEVRQPPTPAITIRDKNYLVRLPEGHLTWLDSMALRLAYEPEDPVPPLDADKIVTGTFGVDTIGNGDLQ